MHLRAPASGLERLLAVAPGDGALRALSVALAEAVPDSDGALVALETGGRLRVAAGAGVAPDGPAPPIAAHALRRGRLVRGRPAGAPFTRSARSAAAAPLRLSRGAVVLAMAGRHGPGPEAEALLRVAAAQADLAALEARLARAVPDRSAPAGDDERRRAVDFILGVVGHDLRNPLGAISMSAALLHGRGGLEGWQARAVDRVRSSAGRMGRIIADLLSYTRARLGAGLPVQRREARLDAIVRKVADELEAQSPDRRFELTLEGDPAGAWDPDRLEQLASNLLANAVEHGEPGQPVRVAVRGAEDRVELEVRNAGELPPKVAAQLFEPFSRPPDAESKKASGLGLGLFIAREIARAHGGDVTGRAAEGEVVMTVRLPRQPR
ncbi:MAG: HAMP domain-containing sensor histidine kinase [Anaeromyxobacteraceae bacterium]